MTDESNASGNIIPCTFPSCLSAQAAATAGEEIARLKEARDACAEARDRNGKHWAETDRMLKKSMVESDQLRSDIAALKAELSNLIAATKGQTFFHSDEAVNAEMGRLRGEVAASEKCYSDCEEKQMAVNAEAYQCGVENERERCLGIAEEALDATCSCKGCDARRDIADAIRATSLAPQKNTAEQSTKETKP